MTADIDIGLFLNVSDVEKLTEAFPEDEYYLPLSDVLILEINRSQRGHFNIIHQGTGMKADAYPSRSHPLYSWAWSKRIRGALFSGEAWFAPPEYVIAWKLEFYREGKSDKHLRDIAGMVMIQGEALDRKTIEEMVREQKLHDEWAKALEMTASG